METNNEDALDTISRLRAEIKDRNLDIHLSAKYGKELLEKNAELEDQLIEIQSENELLKQDRYSLQLDLETKTQTVNTQNSDIEILKEQYDDLLKKFDGLQKESVKQKQRLNNSEKEKVDFEKAQEDAQRENCALKKQIDSLKQQIQGFHLKAEVSINLGLSEDLDEESNINFYKERNKQLQDALADIQCELESMKLAENSLNGLIKELKEGVEDRDKEIASYSVEVQKARDVATELQGEIEILKLEKLDVNRRGNSVFGELDDRRKAVEKEYKLLSKRYENMKNEYISMKREITNCKGEMVILLSKTSRDYQDAYINKLEDQLGNAKREIQSLAAQLSKATKSLQITRVEQNLTGNNEYEYLRVICEKSEKKVKELENELITGRMKNMTDNDELFQKTQQLYSLQVKFDAQKLENIKLQQKIKELTPVSDADVASMRETRIETLPGYDPDSLKHIDENEKPCGEMSVVSGEAVLTEKGIRCLRTLKRPASRYPYKLDEYVLKELQAKPKEEENSEGSHPQKGSNHKFQTEHSAKKRTTKPPECAQQ